MDMMNTSFVLFLKSLRFLSATITFHATMFLVLVERVDVCRDKDIALRARTVLLTPVVLHYVGVAPAP